MSSWDNTKTYGKVALTTAMSLAAARDGVDAAELHRGYADQNNLRRGYATDDIRRDGQIQAELDRFNATYKFDK